MSITSRTELKEYVLRQLGAPVINIEIDDTQMDDAVNSALSYWQKRHYNGTEQCIFKKSLDYLDLLGNVVKLPNSIHSITNVFYPGAQSETLNDSGITAFDDLEWQLRDLYSSQVRNYGSFEMTSYYLMKTHFEMMRYLLNVNSRFNFNKATHEFKPFGWSFSQIPIANRIVNPEDPTKDDWTKNYSTVTTNTEAMPSGTLAAHKISAIDTVNAFGIEQEIDLKFYQSYDFTVKLNVKAAEYNTSVVLTVLDEDDNTVASKTLLLNSFFKTEYMRFRLKHKNKSKIKIRLQSAVPASNIGDGFIYNKFLLWRNPFIVLEGYKAMDPADHPDIWNESFMRDYTTALAKKQWGSNIKKFGDMQLPGGISYNGQQIFDEAVEEISNIKESFSLSSELPVDFFIA